MKKVIAALALGLLIGSATTAIAATDTVQATIAKFKFVVNGQEQHLKSEPLVRNGVTYLPVRETAELLGADVGYVPGTITLKTKDGVGMTETVTAEWVSLRELSDQIRSVGGVITVGGEDSKMTIDVPGNPVTIDTPTETGTYPVDGSDRQLTVKVESGTTYLLLEDLKALGIV